MSSRRKEGVVESRTVTPLQKLLREFLVEAHIVETIDQAMRQMVGGHVLRKSGGDWKIVSNKEAPLLPGKWKVRRKGVFTITPEGKIVGLILASSATAAGVSFPVRAE